MAFDPGGDRLFVSGADGRVRTWDRAAEAVHIADPAGVGPFAVNPAGNVLQLAGTSKDRSSVVLRDVARSEILQTLRSPIEGQPIEAWTLTPDASLVGVASRKADGAGAIAIWSTRPGRLVRTIAADRLTDIALSPDGAILAAGSDDGRVHVWALPEGRPIATLPVGRAEITCLQFGPDPRRRQAAGPPEGRWLLAVGDAAGGVSVWDLLDRIPRSTMRGSEFEVYALAFNPDGMTLASCGRFAVRLWDLATGRHLLDVEAGNFLISLAYSPDGRRLAVGRKAAFGNDGGVDVWELEDGRGIRTLRGLLGRVEKAVLSPDGKRLAALSHDWSVAVWDRRDGHLLHRIEVPVGFLADNSGLAFSPDGHRLAVSAGRAATLWDLRTGAAIRSWDLPAGLGDELIYRGPGHILLARFETKDGRGEPFTQYDPETYPRVCVVRDLLRPDARTPLAVIADFSIYPQQLQFTPDGASLLAQGLGGTRKRRSAPSGCTRRRPEGSSGTSPRRFRPTCSVGCTPSIRPVVIWWRSSSEAPTRLSSTCQPGRAWGNRTP